MISSRSKTVAAIKTTATKLVASARRLLQGVGKSRRAAGRIHTATHRVTAIACLALPFARSRRASPIRRDQPAPRNGAGPPASARLEAVASLRALF